MILAAVESLIVLGIAALIPFEVDRYFVKNLIPLPSWPYGVSIAVFAFFFLKTLCVFFRSLIVIKGMPLADRRGGQGKVR